MWVAVGPLLQGRKGQHWKALLVEVEVQLYLGVPGVAVQFCLGSQVMSCHL